MPSLVNSIILPKDKSVVHSPLVDRLLYLHSWVYRLTGYFSRFARYYENDALREFVLSGRLEAILHEQLDLVERGEIEDLDSVSTQCSIYIGMWEAHFGFYRKFKGSSIAMVDSSLDTLLEEEDE